MIRIINGDDITTCVDLIKNEHINTHQIRYYPTSSIDILRRIEGRITSVNHQQYVLYENDLLIAYLEVLIEKDESYIQILSYFSSKEYKENLKKFIIYLKELYANYKIDFVISDKNTDIIDVLNELKAKTDGIEIMMSISNAELPRTHRDDHHIINLSKSFETEFVAIHNMYYKDVYWDSTRLLNNLDRFNIYISQKDNGIDGYIVVSNFNRSEEEIYFIYTNDHRLKLDLIGKIHDNLSHDIHNILLLLSGDEIVDLEQYKKIGFKIKEKIYTYHI